MVSGVAEGAGGRAALLGGEMSEHPGVMEPGEFDLVGFAVGVVERSEVLPRDVRAGDRIIGFASPGLRCNGYSLARRRCSSGPAWTCTNRRGRARTPHSPTCCSSRA